ncbi:Corepressor interacting with RBPJ 1 [Nymphon striatum]|nr:Corepressor interacting with RBPJ 1 [Nymphon striatum]
MGKGFNNYMCKKDFHPGSKDNIKRVWMAQQKIENEQRKQEELKTQYEKEQDTYNNRALISTESKDKLDLNFMYEAPPGAKKQDDDPEFKFEWQRKYNAPREVYAKDNADIRDQPFGIQVRNVRCIKCHKWGHINTDKECPLFRNKSATNDEGGAGANMDPLELMKLMREEGLALKQTLLGRKVEVNNPNQMIIESEEEDCEMEFLKSLTLKQKEKLLRKLKKSEKKKSKKSKKKKSKSHKKSSSSSSDDEIRRKHKKKHSKRKNYSSDSSSSESDDDQKKQKRHHSKANDSSSDSSSSDSDENREKKYRKKNMKTQLSSDQRRESSKYEPKDARPIKDEPNSSRSSFQNRHRNGDSKNSHMKERHFEGSHRRHDTSNSDEKYSRNDGHKQKPRSSSRSNQSYSKNKKIKQEYSSEEELPKIEFYHFGSEEINKGSEFPRSHNKHRQESQEVKKSRSSDRNYQDYRRSNSQSDDKVKSRSREHRRH